MVKVFLIAIGIVIMSSSFFPFVFTFFPFANTKMLLAFCGLILYIYRSAISGHSSINRDSFILTICALGVSFASLAAMIWNGTTDGTYLTYIISMWVWLGASYFAVNVLRQIHGTITTEIVCCYMVAVGALQCLIALAIDMNSSVEQFVSLFLEGEGFMGKKDGRLYGIGCSTDVGGSRLAALLIMNVSLMFVSLKYKKYTYRLLFLLASFFIIAVLGNMVARTTTVGLVLSLCLFIYLLLSGDEISYEQKKKLVKNFSIGIIFCVLLFSVLSITNNQWAGHLRFGFEGFYSLVENGSWQVKSNDMLMEGFIYPDNLKTWIIGDGYMGDPHNNPYYIGPESWGFYMNTDAGYSRFIFYFGLIGLGAFMYFFIQVCQICIKRSYEYRIMFLLILILNFVIWVKVTTDIFMIFAPFLCISAEENEDGLKINDNIRSVYE